MTQSKKVIDLDKIYSDAETHAYMKQSIGLLGDLIKSEEEKQELRKDNLRLIKENMELVALVDDYRRLMKLEDKR